MKKLLLVAPDYEFYPLSLAFVITILRNNGIDYDVLDLHRGGNLRERVESGEYWAVATTGLIMNYNAIQEIFTEVKQLDPRIVTILGGRAVFAPVRLLEKLPMDYAVMGDAEGTMPDLVHALLAGEKDMSKVRSIMYRASNNSLVRTEKRKLPSLKTLEPTWDDFDMQYYISSDLSNNYWVNSYPVISGMGCVGKCTFCRPGIRGARVRPVERVLEEMQSAMEKYDFSYFAFLSEIFYRKKEDVFAFCDGYKKSKMDLPWTCSMRVDFDPELLPPMADAGIKSIFVGLESIDDYSLKMMGKNTTEAMIDRFITKAQDCGIEIIAGAMAATMGDTADSLYRTLDYVKKKRIITTGFSSLILYPGTQVYDYALEEGIIKDETAYCDSLFKDKWETSFYGPLYPNVTNIPIDELINIHENCQYDLEEYRTLTFPTRSLDIDRDTATCNSCGKEFYLSRGAHASYVCKYCMQYHQVSMYFSMLKDPEVSESIKSLISTADKIGIVGGVNFAKGLLYLGTERGIDSDKIRLVGSGAKFGANVDSVGFDDLGDIDTVLMGGMHEPGKVTQLLAEKGISEDRILNVTPGSFKRRLQRKWGDENTLFEYTCNEDIMFFGESIAQKMMEKYGPDVQWAILPAGGYGVSIYEGFIRAGAQVSAMMDSYKSAENVPFDIPVFKPGSAMDVEVNKAIICTPAPDTQRQLKDIIVDSGVLADEDVILLHDMYELLWDHILI